MAKKQIRLIRLFWGLSLATEPPRPECRTIEVVTSTGNAGILPAINDYSVFFAGKMPAFPVEVTDKVVLFIELGEN